MTRPDYAKPVYGRFRVPKGSRIWYRKTVEYDWHETNASKDIYFRRCEYTSDGCMVFMELPYFLKVASGDVETLSRRA